ncbi:SIR2 family protein [Pseudomonas marginalis]|uniref:SIR2 family protein n=1 Tax=Pseudomonas TaxID=286 RepID=UPI0011EDA604|nr:MULTISPECIES: SIR2 family protein [unclassified Pseudomonas]KAA0947833.1 SIR2 family protein [Pseudomonas sp. ANT_H4]KAA0947916.1 SIR2 family protein [Pseudomonas sp. ANT_H14]
MSGFAHCPYRQSSLLQQALAPNKMRIAFLLGAGCPMSIRVDAGNGNTAPLIPDIAGLTSLVATTLTADAELSADYTALIGRFGVGASPNIEEILSHLRALIDVVRDGDINGLTKPKLQALDKRICELTAGVVGVPLPGEGTPYHKLAAWMSGIARAHAVEVFTPNYDLLMEQALESHKVPYFDGFVGAREAFFDLSSMETDILPARWARVWKLHGSINWWRTPENDVIRKNNGDGADRQMIYPSHLKYDQSRRLPYLAMLDRLRDFLGRGQAILVCCGYSFADQHLNEVIMNGLRSNPTAMCFGLLYGARSQYSEAILCATRQPNLSILAEDGAVLGTLNRNWNATSQDSHSLHGVAVSSVTENDIEQCKFGLGDFKKLGQFLAHQLNQSSDVGTSHEA